MSTPMLKLRPRHSAGASPVASRFSLLAFDEWLESDAPRITAETSPRHDDRLGSLDQLAIEAITGGVSAAIGPVSLTIRVAHSADGHHWLFKRDKPEVYEPSVLSLSGPTYMNIGLDDGTMPSLCYVRLVLTLTAVEGPIRARVKVHVTANDLHEQQFAAAAQRAQKGFDRSRYNIRYPGGSVIESSRVKEAMPYLRAYYRVRERFEGLPGGQVTLVITLPARLAVWFSAANDYILVDGDRAVWSSAAYRDATATAHDAKPPKAPNDPRLDMDIGPSKKP